MNILENVKTALSAIAANKLRAFLTMLGVIIGVYAVSTMISLGQLATGKITTQLNEIGGSQIAIFPDWEKASARNQSFTSDDVAALSSLPISNISTDSINLQASTEKSSGSINLNGTFANYTELSGDVKLAQGRYFSEAENQASAPVIVLNDVAARKYFDGEDALGKKIRLARTMTWSDGTTDIQREDFTVIGISKPVGGALGGSSAAAYTPINYIWRYYGTRDEYSTLMFKLDSDAVADQERVIDDITRILEARRGSKDFDVANFDQFLEQFKTITGALQAMLAGIGGLSLLVGGIGIMTFSMIGRVSLGHTGRNIHAPPKRLIIGFFLLLLALLFRVIMPLFLPSQYLVWMIHAQALWIIAFILLVTAYVRIWATPRPDGRPG